MISGATISTEDVDDSLNVGCERPRFTDGLAFLRFKTESATVEVDFLTTKLTERFLHRFLLPQFVVGGPFENDAPFC